MYQKFDILLVDLNPIKGSEQSGVRPCIIIQNDNANRFAKTFVIAIISSVIKEYPHTLIVKPSINNGLREDSRIDLLQVRTIDELRIIKKLGSLDENNKSELNMKLLIAFDL